jgi:hypothetical protein
MKVIFDDYSWFVGERGFRESIDESEGCHHFRVLSSCDLLKEIVGEEIAVYLNKPKVFILNWKKMEVK